MSLRLTSTRAKLLASGALVAAAAGAAGLGTFGSFTSTTSASASVGSGKVAIALGPAGSTPAALPVVVSGIVPGDTVQRVATLNNTGNQALSAVTLTTAATTSSKLDSDTTNGLQLQVDSCSAPWTEAGTAPAYTYSCSGTTTPVLASRPVIGSNLNLASLNSLAAGKSDNLRFTLTFPSGADNSFQNLSSTIDFTFTGTQRAGANQ